MTSLGWWRCGGSECFMTRSEMSRNPVGATVNEGEEIGNFSFEMSGIMEGIKWSEGEGDVFSLTLPAFIITKFVVLSYRMKALNNVI
jgi:hypothetical protein